MHAGVDVDDAIVVADLADIESVDGHGAGRNGDLLTGAHQFVGAAPIDLDRGHLRRNLHDIAGQQCDLLVDRVVGYLRRVVRFGDLALRIICGRGRTEADRRFVDLVLCDQVRQQLRAALNACDKHARGHRVERASVANLARAKEAAQSRDHVMTRQALRLIDDNNAGLFEGIVHAFEVCRTVSSVDILRGLDAVPETFGEPGGTVVTIGVFDGVHRGHQLLISKAVDTARELGVPSVVMTFDPHPVTVFAPGHTPAALMSLEERARHIAELGVDYLLVIDFRHELGGVSPEGYVEDVLVGQLRARHVLVGENFTFGKDAAGTATTMAQLGERAGIDVTIVRLLSDGGVKVCSTAIRDELSGGNVQTATDYMGRPFSVITPIERGAGRGGKELGYPTANQYASDAAAIPADGVYAGWLTIIDDAPIDGDMEPGVRYPAAISVGTNPTFGDNRRSVESFVLDRDADLYGRMARVEFVGKVRDMVKFDSVEELLEHMARDVDTTRDILGA